MSNPCGQLSLKSGASLVALSVALAVSSNALAGALPSGGHYVAGQGNLSKAGQSLTVKQSSTTGIIDWKSFSVGTGDRVSFANGAGATLNVVKGGNLSLIAGSLHATGSLYLMNSAGVIVSGTGKVVTGGNFAATSGTAIGNVFEGLDPRFAKANAVVINRGTIISGGEAKLVGGNVLNSGTIRATAAIIHAEYGNAGDSGTIRADRILVISDTGRTFITGDLSTNGAGTIETSGHAASISGRIDAGKEGTWVIDPVNLMIDSAAAATIDNSLNDGTNVTLKTTDHSATGPGNAKPGPGNIEIMAALSWNTAAKLTLDAFHSILIDAPISLTGNGKLALRTNGGGADGDLSFDGGDVTFAHLTSVLTINGVLYTLVDNIATLASDIAADPSGDYALAHSYNAKGHGTYTRSPIATKFAGTFEGLGNTISNLTIVARASQRLIGLFSSESATGTIENVTLKNVDVEGNKSNSLAAALVVVARGMIRNDFASGSVADSVAGASAGGLVGNLDGGTIINSHASDGVASQANIGGLVGEMENGTISVSSATGFASGGIDGSNAGGLVGIMVSSTIDGSYATGSEGAGGDGAWVGGLVGEMDGKSSISNSYATGNNGGSGNTAGYGGLVGYMGVGSHDTIANSYATGSVNASGNNTGLGGLVGYIDYNGHNSITNSYATGSVTGADNTNDGGLVGYVYYGGTNKITRTYATGAVSGGSHANVGGLVGYNLGAIKDSYATGAVTGGMTAYVGGLVGWNYNFASSVGTIATSYSTGLVSGSGSIMGGLVGFDTTPSGSIVNSYWDTTTSGIASLSEGAGNMSNDSGITGRSTTQLQSGLPKGFASSVWAESATINGGFPYLKALASSY